MTEEERVALCFIKHDTCNMSAGLHWWKVTKNIWFSHRRKTKALWDEGFVWMDDLTLPSMENPFWAVCMVFLFYSFFLCPPPSRRDLRETFVLCCHCYFCPNSAVKRFMAVACAHSYSFVSIETLSPGQACILELHKALPVIRNTLRYEYSCLTGILF